MDRLFVKILIVAFAIFGLSFSTTMAAAPYRAHFVEMKCKDPQTGREIFIGDVYTRSGQCVLVQCLGNLQLWEDKCLVPTLKGTCTPVPPANEFLDYPKCCPIYECKTYQITDNGQMEETRTYDQYGRQIKSIITQVLVIQDARNFMSEGYEKSDAQFDV